MLELRSGCQYIRQGELLPAGGVSKPQSLRRRAFQEIEIRHAKYASSRFAHRVAPALTRFANSSPQGFANSIKAAWQQVAARSEEDRADFLRKRGFSKFESGKIIEKVLIEEGRPPESIFDFVQDITRLARDKTQ